VGYSEIEFVIILLGLLQGLILLVALNRPGVLKSRSRHIFSAFLLVIMLTLFGNSFFVLDRLGDYPHMGLFMDDMYFLYGPLLYLYVGALLNKRLWFEKKKWVHFLLPLLHILSMMEYILMSPAEFLSAMGAGVWQYPYDQALAILSITFYLGLSWRLYQGHTARNSFSFLKYVFGVLIVGILLWVNQFAVNVFGLSAGAWLSRYTNPWTLFPMITIVMGYFAVANSALFVPDNKPLPYGGSPLSDDEIKSIKRRLLTLMQESKPYLDSKLSLGVVARSLSVQSKDLSRVINQEFELNFFDFVNTYRLQEFKRIATPEALTVHSILGLAFDAGFNSKSAFNKVFKRLEGVTPSQYLKKRNDQ
jgi:AraC-like DNA-binding protein